MSQPSFLTADLFDAHGDRSEVCSTQLRNFGGRRAFCGPIRTVVCQDDNVLLRRQLEQPSPGEVLVVDGGDSLASALIGDIIAGLGQKNGWAGVVIFGAVRDAVAIGQLDFGVKALGTNPRKSAKLGTGRVGGVIEHGGAEFIPGHWLYSDEDGILIAPEKL